MTTSIVVYLPHTSRKHVLAVIADVEHQMQLRAERKRPGRDMTFTWLRCRCDPGIWEMTLTTANPAESLPYIY